MHYYTHRISDFPTGSKRKDFSCVYVLATQNFEYIKIGKSKDLKQRVRNIQSGCPFDLQLWLGIKTPLASRIEPYLHKRLAGCALRGEWFKPSEADLDWLHVFFAETNKHIKEVCSAGMAKRSL